jgi:hypothetical protein
VFWWRGIGCSQSLLLDAARVVAFDSSGDQRLLFFRNAISKVEAKILRVSIINTERLMPFEVIFEENLLRQLQASFPHDMPPPTVCQLNAVASSASVLNLPAVYYPDVIAGTKTIYWHERRCRIGASDFFEGPVHHPTG